MLDNSKTVLATTPARWSSLVASLRPELLAQRPATSEWSAAECLQHLVDTEHNVVPVRVRAFLAHQDFPSFDPDKQGTKVSAMAPSELATEFSQLRADSLTLLERVKPDDLSQQVGHSELGMVTLEQMLHEWAGHDLMHTVQGEHALLQPFIRAFGPWRVYFADHNIDIAHHS